MMKKFEPDFKMVNRKANEILVASDTIVDFPIPVKKIIKEWTDIELRSYKQAQNKGIDIKAFGSESAIIQNYGGKYIIFYNQDENKARVRFSILHEFGHYYLGHSMDDENISKYAKKEVETNCFAAQILMPEQVIYKLQSKGIKVDLDFLIDNFKVSKEAASKRLETLRKLKPEWKNSDEAIFDETILFKYQGFISKFVSNDNDIGWFENEYELQRERNNWY